jgi:hypothetical protein
MMMQEALHFIAALFFAGAGALAIGVILASFFPPKLGD